MIDRLAYDRSKPVLIADPQPLYRLGLLTLLSSAYPGWDVVQSDTLNEHRTQLIGGVFGLLIVDSRLLGAESALSTPIRGRVNLSATIIAVTDPGDEISVLGCIAAGADATISRNDPTARMLSAIESLPASGPQHTAAPGLDHRLPSTSATETTDTLNLTSRQFDVLRLLALGQSNKVIARDLGLSVSTVKVHLNTVFRALGARNRVEAVVRARPFQARMLRQGQL